jgi:hypothetical protein
MKKLLVLIGGLVLAAGCSPAVMHSSDTPKGSAATQQVSEQTVADSAYTISDACRAELQGLTDGPDILARYDVWFGYWKAEGNPPNEVANTATGFRYEAKAAGATTC